MLVRCLESVGRETPMVRAAAAMVAPLEISSRDPETLGGHDAGAAAAAASCSSCGKAGAGPLDDECPLGFGEGGHHVEHDLAGDRVGGVDTAVQCPPARARRLGRRGR